MGIKIRELFNALHHFALFRLTVSFSISSKLWAVYIKSDYTGNMLTYVINAESSHG